MKNHKCDACDGTGFWLDGIIVCGVCLGSGMISDVMPVADSLADAETLEMVADDAACWEGTPEPSGMLYGARAYGLEAVTDAQGYSPYSDGYAYVGAWRAAQYAFRAVPELRS